MNRVLERGQLGGKRERLESLKGGALFAIEVAIESGML